MHFSVCILLLNLFFLLEHKKTDWMRNCVIIIVLKLDKSLDSSVGITLGYRLDNWGSRI